MPTCGECVYLVKNKAGAYICAGKLTQCLGGITPETDAKEGLIRWYNSLPVRHAQLSLDRGFNVTRFL